MQPPSHARETPADQRSRVRHLIREMNVRLTEGVDYERLLDYAFESLSEVIPYDRIGVALLDEGERTVTSKWMRTRLPGKHLTVGYSARLAGSSLEEILRSGRPRILNDLEAYLRQNPHSTSTKAALGDGIRSSLTFPLKAQGKRVGFVFFSSGRQGTYTEAHVDVFSEVAEEVSLLVQHGRLRRFFDESQSSHRSLRAAVHDLKTPLTVIHGYLDMVVREPWFEKLDENTKRIFNVLKRNSNRMFELTAELNAFTLAERRMGEITPKAVPLADFLDEIEESGRLLAMRKNIAFRTARRGALPEVAYFDPLRIREVLDNLISNAVKYSAPGSEIAVTMTGESDGMAFSVRDTGLGIPADEIPKLFQEFGTTRVKPTGGETSTGLGLAIASRIVRKHGGDITVQSREGVGSTFTFWIPATIPSS